jgi:hypothetical protein
MMDARWPRYSPVLAVPCLVAAAPLYARDYLSAEQARRLMFPEAARYAPQTLRLDAGALAALGQRAGTPLQTARMTLELPLAADGTPLGLFFVDEVRGKYEWISYAVGVGTDGAIRQVEILSYRESHGYEVSTPAWRKQFVGKTAQSPIRLQQDIANISGATLSCAHITDGVRGIAVLAQALLAAGLRNGGAR